MVDTEATEIHDEPENLARVYEVGYHVIPTVVDEALEKNVASIRSTIEKNGGSFIAEGAPSLMRLSYDMEAREGDRKVSHDRGWFGWIKFESTPAGAAALEEALKQDQTILRSIVFRTIREETRARIKPNLREVKRTDTIRTTPRRAEEQSAEVSEVDLDKAISEITSE